MVFGQVESDSVLLGGEGLHSNQEESHYRNLEMQ